MANDQLQRKYENLGYSKAEVDILIELAVVKSELQSLKDAGYIRREEFAPVQKLVYGMVGVILVAFLTAVIALVVTR